RHWWRQGQWREGGARRMGGRTRGETGSCAPFRLRHQRASERRPVTLTRQVRRVPPFFHVPSRAHLLLPHRAKRRKSVYTRSRFSTIAQAGLRGARQHSMAIAIPIAVLLIIVFPIAFLTDEPMRQYTETKMNYPLKAYTPTTPNPPSHPPPPPPHPH